MSSEGFMRCSLHSFCKGLFATIGVWLGFIPLFILLIIIGASGRAEINVPGKYIILPNADGSRAPLGTRSPIVLQINIDGVIRSKERLGVSAAGVQTQLLHSREGALKHDRVKAVLLNVNTPGGEALEADTIYRALVAYKRMYDVPIYAYVEGLCASGGMYIASSADKILSSPTGLIGSVGVISNFFNLYETLQKIGVDPKTIYDGKGKDKMNPFRPWEADDFEQMQRITDFLYNRFVDIVVEARPNITKSQLVNEYGAQLFAAPNALKLGYVDAIVFNRNEAIETLVTENEIGEDYQVVEFEEHIGIIDLISAESPAITGKIRHEIDLPEVATLNGYLYLYLPGV